jgi:Holliday junction DNA helicase RuvA
MYSYIIGNVTENNSNSIVIECNGIGYLVYVPNPFSYEIGCEYKVYVYNKISEEEYSLYGFKIKEEYELFLKLISVKGLGPKLALPILATGSIAGIIDAIDRENILYLTKFPKIGEKLARQIILDLKGKINIEVSGEIEADETEDLIDTLTALGYKTSEIKKIVGQIDKSNTLENQVKEALKLLLK